MFHYLGEQARRSGTSEGSEDRSDKQNRAPRMDGTDELRTKMPAMVVMYHRLHRDQLCKTIPRCLNSTNKLAKERSIPWGYQDRPAQGKQATGQAFSSRLWEEGG